ncbi:MAG: hypothetical protein AAF628_36950 [Planctomycetota bacterium]
MKRIQATTLQEAVDKTIAECGADALLVETRRTRSGYMVIAGKPQPPRRRRAVARPKWTRGFRPLAKRGRTFGLSNAVLTAVEKAMIDTRVRLEREGDPAVPTVAARVLKALIRSEAMELPRYKVTAVIGTTGVGKTTTLAKLAAVAVRERGEQVAIVTIDTYRMAAVEQLRAFADLIDTPCEVAFTPQELRRAVHQHASADRIFIDTSGGSPRDRKALLRLAAQLRLTKPACLLCLPASTRRVDAHTTLVGYEPCGIDTVALTKWDETEVPGEALSVVIEQGLSISHLTVGQEVPEDLVAADANDIANHAFALEPDSLEATAS